MSETQSNQQNWLFRFVKGMFIGSGFIVPGISGGALAAIFGVYETIISFLANPFKNLKKNILFFIPIAIGALVGIAILSWGISYLLGNYDTIIRWFFVGAVVGTAPALWKEAGEQGRNQSDIIVLVVSFILGTILLFYGEQLFGSQVAPSFTAWIICGFLIALGILIPGLSPSNFILYMGLYQDMADGFKSFDLSVLIPIAIGGLLTIVLLAKIIEWIFNHYYSPFFHFIVGIVAASTLMIIPWSPSDYQGFTMIQYLLCLILLIAGIALGAWMARLEEKYK